MTNNSNNNNQLLKNNDISPIPTKSHLITNTNNQINVKLIEKEGMFHIYPMFPIPEAKQALNQIIEYVKFNE